MGEILEKLGIGLSRLLRYAYPGFLLVGFLSVVNDDLTKRARDAMGWELAAVTALVVGAGAYAVHRGVVVPVHHALLCLWWLVADLLTGRWKKAESANPTRWLGSLGVDWLWRIPAYTILRRSDLFKDQKAEWDIAHAESGLVLMTAEAFLLAGLYIRDQTPIADILFWSSGVLLAFSFLGFGQHALECLHFRAKESDVRARLKALGLLR
jgi:hypothetical protein